VIAILKNGDASLASNYRPISLISCVGKIMERVVYKNVYKLAFNVCTVPNPTMKDSILFSRNFQLYFM
jgi:hypothetical protein